jgi:transketolase
MTRTPIDAQTHQRLANSIRALAMDAVEKANSGHPGMPMGMADIATVLFTRFLNYDPADPAWPDRDRFIISNGHGSMLLYALLYLTGYPSMTIEQIKQFRQLGSLTPGHPEYHHTPGVETTTGPLGQGVGNAVGMALAERLLAERFGHELVDHHTYVFAGDGCLMEGISHEAASLAGHLRLNKLILLFDDNHISIDGPTSLAVSDDQRLRFEAHGWATAAVDGQDPDAIADAIEQAHDSDRPTLIACRTTIGFGSPKKAGTAAAHGSPLGAAEIAATREALGWHEPPFVIPDDLLERWRQAGREASAGHEPWRQRLAGQTDKVRAAWREALDAAPDFDVAAALAELKAKYAQSKPKIATRKASQEVITAFAARSQKLLGGSADLTGSNLTKADGSGPAATNVTAESTTGRYIHYGVREHGMAATMNGIAVHGGFIPYGGTFLCFTDYARPSIRLSALMGAHVIYVMTHDSIGQGEDGPTHQPIEHLASLRAMPHMTVLRPADAIETAECWAWALAHSEGPSILVLSRQGLPALRTDADGRNRSAEGAYVLAGDAEGKRDVTILATGSEVHVAVAAGEALARDGVKAAIVSMPSWELFEQQDPARRQSVLGEAPRIAVESASPFGWTRYVASEAHVVGLTTFGASAPGEVLMEHFGFTADNVAEKARWAIGQAGKH